MITNNKYKILIKAGFIHINNYIKINDISINKIRIELLDNILIINGNNLIISKLDEYELSIKGNIKELLFDEK